MLSMSQWSNGVYLTHQEPWRGDEAKMRMFDWINNDRHERGIRHLEYEHDSTRYPWVRPTTLAKDTPAIAIDVDDVKPPPGFGPQPEALSGKALLRWEQEQHEVITRRQARLNMLESVHQDRKDSAQDRTWSNTKWLGRPAKEYNGRVPAAEEARPDAEASGLSTNAPVRDCSNRVKVIKATRPPPLRQRPSIQEHASELRKSLRARIDELRKNMDPPPGPWKAPPLDISKTIQQPRRYTFGGDLIDAST
ncbi:hypothetical protein N0V87_010207 [Didymella glomerata]|uniref:Uncharacterized protein n=1 Tax=Didymella glomerata TaxID=749621 RepID=A0A9W9BUH4_9PLEO|nr:hypothetical protein N0V87_010207 [Didymella glomerata]